MDTELLEALAEGLLQCGHYKNKREERGVIDMLNKSAHANACLPSPWAGTLTVTACPLEMRVNPRCIMMHLLFYAESLLVTTVSTMATAVHECSCQGCQGTAKDCSGGQRSG